MGGIKINSSNTLKYFGLKFIIYNFLHSVSEKILKFIVASFHVFLSADWLGETVKCEIIVQKCLPIWMMLVYIRFTLPTRKFSHIFLSFPCGLISLDS